MPNHGVGGHRLGTGNDLPASTFEAVLKGHAYRIRPWAAELVEGSFDMAKHQRERLCLTYLDRAPATGGRSARAWGPDVQQVARAQCRRMGYANAARSSDPTLRQCLEVPALGAPGMPLICMRERATDNFSCTGAISH
jgi:hypothetical protein